VTRLLVIGFDRTSSRLALRMATEHSGVQAVIGIHPESAAEWCDEEAADLKAFALDNRRDVVALGEIGLDYYWDSVARDLQKGVFEDQLTVAAELDLPVVIHCRDAYTDVIDTLERRSFHRAVLHCFTGTESEARRAVDLGLYIGVGGIATFKKSEDLRATVATVPLERILIETDAPYLAPQPWRGKRNEPAYIVAVAQMLASVKGQSVDEIAAATSTNADRLFRRME
jgi:TatD DNase family protein